MSLVFSRQSAFLHVYCTPECLIQAIASQTADFQHEFFSQFWSNLHGLDGPVTSMKPLRLERWKRNNGESEKYKVWKIVLYLWDFYLGVTVTVR